MTQQVRHLYEFGPFQIDPAERLLLHEGQPVPLTAKAFDTLLVLVQRDGHLIEKSELMKLVWRDSFVEEGNLTVTISMLRKALGDDGSAHKYIQTVAKHGYRFVGEVHEAGQPVPSAVPPPPLAITEPALPGAVSFPRQSGWALKITILALVLTLITAAVLHFRKPVARPAAIHSVAVLPFQSLNSGPADKYLGLGMADAIITELGSTGEIVVRPTSAVMKYTNSADNWLTAGREQKVDAILTGHIEKFPDQVRVTVQLVRAANGALLWAGTFEESPQNMFALENEVARKVAQSMSVRLTGEAKMRLAEPHPENFKAYQLYLEGRYFWNQRTKDGLRRSIQCFQQATAQDPQYALAYAGLADAYVLLGSYGVESAQQAYPSAKAAAIKALQLDNSLAPAHAALGMISFYYEWKWSEAEKEFERAIALNPNDATAHLWYAVDLAAMGQLQKALDEAESAHQLDPLSFIINTDIGHILYFSRQYARAIAAYQNVVNLNPQFARAHTRLGMAYAAEGRFKSAIHEFREAQRLSGPDPYLYGLLGYAQALSGNTVEARKLLDALIQRSHRQYVPAYSMAMVSIGLGERDHAMQWLEKAYQDRSTYLVYAKTDPLLDPVRSDPRFTSLLQRTGLR